MTSDTLISDEIATDTLDLTDSSSPDAPYLRDLRGAPEDALTARERDVLLLASEGFDTLEIGRRLAYSERTVKNVIHGVMTRHGLRNRTQTVAFAIRQGWI